MHFTRRPALDAQPPAVAAQEAEAPREELARALVRNRSLMQLNLIGQKGTKFGDTTLAEFIKTFDVNVTLLKIVWRLESRQSFSLNKKLVRNNDIDRRIKAGKDYADILPEGAAPLPPALIAHRAAAGCVIGTPRAAETSGAAPDSWRSSVSDAPSDGPHSRPRAMPQCRARNARRRLPRPTARLDATTAPSRPRPHPARTGRLHPAVVDPGI